MAMSLSFRETGSDEANDNVVDICSYCATQDKLQPATHFCFDCGVYGRYICGICERNHKLFLDGHDAIYIGSQTNKQRNQRYNQKEILKLKKENLEQETKLNQQNEELERRQKYIQQLENEVKDLNTKICIQQKESVTRYYQWMDESSEKGNNENRRLQSNLLKVTQETDTTARESDTYRKASDDVKTKEAKYKENKQHFFGYLKRNDKQTKRFNPVWVRKPNEDSKIVVAAIEIGTALSTYAYSFIDQYRADPFKMTTNQNWPSMKERFMHVPTVVLFQENKQFHSFGFEAEDTYSELTLDNKHHKWYFFKRFKKELNENKTELTDVKGKKMNTVVVFGAVIKYLKDSLLETLNAKSIIQNDDIYWVLPVPVMWTMFIRQIIQQAAYTAGIDDRQLAIVSEPEVCSLFCEVASVKKMKGLNRCGGWPDSIAVEAIKCPGTKYMVIDLGENTTDITVYERQTDAGIKELYKASCESCCGANVDEEFYRLLKRILGDSVFQKIMNEYPEDYLDFQRDFKLKKRTFRSSCERMRIRVPNATAAIYKEEMGKTIEEAINGSPYCSKIRILREHMTIDSQIVKDWFKPCSDEIIAHIQDLLKQPDVQGTNIFLMVGRFSESVMIQDAIMKSLPSGKVVFPDEPSLAALKGAVIYGHHYLKH